MATAMTQSNLQSFIETLVLANKQVVSSLSAVVSSIDAMVDKIGRQIMLTGVYEDDLPELEGPRMPMAKIIEEYFVNLTLPELTTAGDGTITPNYPSFDDAVYSLPLPKARLKTSIPFNDIEASVNNPAKFAEVITKIMKAFNDSYTLTRKYSKKQLLGNLIKKVDAASSGVKANAIVTLAKPVDTATGEAFIKAIKNAAEVANRENENNSLSGKLIGKTPKLVLYIKEGIKSSIDVDTLAGAFHSENLDIPATVKVLQDFGSAGDSGKTYAILMDSRIAKLCNTANYTLSALNADDAFRNYVKHFQDTAFISTHAFVRIFRTS